MLCKIAIDGPAGSGKTTIARKLAKRLGITYLDTGAMYRIIALYLKSVDADPNGNLEKVLENLSLKYENGAFVFNNEVIIEDDIRIRTPEAGRYASLYAANPYVRNFLTNVQREITKDRSIVAEGRDIGTVVMPDAPIKIFLTASDEVRAKRRYEELKEKGKEVEFEKILKEIKERDENDSNREFAPLTIPEDAIIIDTSNLTIDGVVEKILEIVKVKCQNLREF